MVFQLHLFKAFGDDFAGNNWGERRTLHRRFFLRLHDVVADRAADPVARQPAVVKRPFRRVCLEDPIQIEVRVRAVLDVVRAFAHHAVTAHARVDDLLLERRARLRRMDRDQHAAARVYRKFPRRARTRHLLPRDCDR